MNITKSFVEKFTSLGARSQSLAYDDELKGFGVRVTKFGAKAFFIEKVISGKQKRKVLGTFPAVTVKAARAEAQRLLGQIAMGIDPWQVDEAAKFGNLTLIQVWNEYISIRESLKESTQKEYGIIIGRDFVDWLKKPVREITRDMIFAKHKELGEKSKARANLALRVLKAVLTFTMGRYEGLLNENPVNCLTQTRAWFKVEPRTSYITRDQLAVWLATVRHMSDLKKNENPHKAICANYLLFILFTGLRKEEAVKLKWENIDFKAKTFSVKETKNRSTHTLPFSGVIENILKNMDFVRCNSLVFPNVRDSQKFVKQICKIIEYKFTIHDLRRTFITVAESLDIPHYALKALLNHKSNDVTAGYIIIDAERLREPMEKISNHILGVK